MRELSGARVLVDGFHFLEGPRWRDDSLWCSDMHGHRVVRIGMDGSIETIVEMADDCPSGLGWLPDGRLLVVAMESRQLRRVESDGSLVVHADLASLSVGDCNDMIVAEDGTAYVGDMGYAVHGEGGERQPGRTIMVRADGSARVAAEQLEAPNGHGLSPDGRTLIVAESAASRLTAFDVAPDGSLSNRRVFAHLRGDNGVSPPDGICLDAEGAVWYGDPVGDRFCRVIEGGTITDVVRTSDGSKAIACVLGGSGRRTLLMAVVDDWRREVAVQQTTARIDALEVAVGGAGRP